MRNPRRVFFLVLMLTLMPGCGESEAPPILADELIRTGWLWGIWKTQPLETELGPGTTTYVFAQPNHVRIEFSSTGTPPITMEGAGTFRVTPEGLMEFTIEGATTTHLVEARGETLFVSESDGDRFALSRQ